MIILTVKILYFIRWIHRIKWAALQGYHWFVSGLRCQGSPQFKKTSFLLYLMLYLRSDRIEDTTSAPTGYVKHDTHSFTSSCSLFERYGSGWKFRLSVDQTFTYSTSAQGDVHWSGFKATIAKAAKPSIPTTVPSTKATSQSFSIRNSRRFESLPPFWNQLIVFAFYSRPNW